ncbi:MAG: hypothetical protein RLZZ479_1174, partial [Bacteroidota bacterium]
YEENKEQATTTVLLFYQKTGSTTCGEGDMVSVERVIQKTKTPINTKNTTYQTIYSTKKPQEFS